MTQSSRRRFLQAAAGAAAVAGVASDISADQNVDVSQIGKTPHSKFAVNVEMWWTKLPFLERMRKAAELGFPAVEFWPYGGKNLDAIAKLSKSSSHCCSPQKSLATELWPSSSMRTETDPGVSCH